MPIPARSAQLLLAFSIAACPVAFAQPVPTPAEAAMAKLLQCMKLPLASAPHAACMAEVRRLKTPAPAPAAAMTMRAKAVAMPSSTPAPVQPPPPVPSPVKDAFRSAGLAGTAPQASAATIAPIGGAITVQDLSGLDLESAMMAVQSRRASILESQLNDQIQAVQARNDTISRLNTAIGKMNQYLAAFPAGSTVASTLSATGATHAGPAAEYRQGVPGCRLEQETNTLLSQVGVKPFTQQGSGAYNAKGRMLDPSGNLSYGDPRYYYVGGLGGDTTKGQLEAAIQALKGQIDSANNSQQMDMLKLQSLTNKRNEAFDLMTNFIKKMADSRSSILGNLR